jgi:hypothetical protein
VTYKLTFDVNRCAKALLEAPAEFENFALPILPLNLLLPPRLDCDLTTLTSLVVYVNLYHFLFNIPRLMLMLDNNNNTISNSQKKNWNRLVVQLHKIWRTMRNHKHSCVSCVPMKLLLVRHVARNAVKRLGRGSALTVAQWSVTIDVSSRSCLEKAGGEICSICGFPGGKYPLRKEMCATCYRKHHGKGKRKSKKKKAKKVKEESSEEESEEDDEDSSSEELPHQRKKKFKGKGKERVREKPKEDSDDEESKPKPKKKLALDLSLAMKTRKRARDDDDDEDKDKVTPPKKKQKEPEPDTPSLSPPPTTHKY